MKRTWEILDKVVVLILVVYAVTLEGMAQELYDVTSPGDVVMGVPDDGDWPVDERPELAIDNKAYTKYLHFKGDFNPDAGPTGLRITPSVGPIIVTGLTFSTANDYPGRDPVSFELYGSNETINGPYTLIASGDILDFRAEVAWPRLTKNSTPITFPNYVVYKHYQLLFTAIRGPVGGGVNSMQVAEVELLGSKSGRLKAIGPQPADGSVHGNIWVNLSWMPLELAALHNVYFGTNPDEVTQRKSNVLIATTYDTSTLVGLPGFVLPNGLQKGTTYYWCVDEVNELEHDSPWHGDVWSFQIPTEPVAYLLITNKELAPAFQTLVDRRIAQGFPGRLMTVTDICECYPGVDEAERIRNCVIDYYLNHGVLYLALGGDQTIVPIRWCDPRSSGDYMPADLYYSDIDGGNWDANHNDIYGEKDDVSRVELTPEVHLGRIPVGTVEDAAAYINKITTYETASPEKFANSLICVSGWGELYSGSGRRKDMLHHDPVSRAEVGQVWRYRNIIQPYWQAVPLHFLWDMYSSWDAEVCGDYELTLEHVSDRLNENYHFVFYWGHGAPGAWAMGEGRRFTTTHAAALTNSIPNIVISWACSPAEFDTARICLSEAFVKNPYGGAIAYFGHTRPAGGGEADCEQLFLAMFRDHAKTTGEALTRVMAALAPSRVRDPYRQYYFVLHGDPCIQFLREESGRHLQVFQPKGCEVIERGTDLYIRWNAAGTGFSVGEKIKLEYSPNGGQTWHTIPGAQSLAYNGLSFRWRNCPLAAGSHYRVRVVSLSDPNVYDMSGRDFTIGNLAVLTVQSSPVKYIQVELSGSKTDDCTLATDFDITILEGASVNISAPATVGESSEFAFVRWKDETGNTVTATLDYSFTITQDKTIVAEYAGP